MRTIQMTLDDDLVTEVDATVRKLHTTRSAFARKALKEAIEQVTLNMLEKKHKKGYALNPLGESEFSFGDSEREWGD